VAGSKIVCSIYLNDTIEETQIIYMDYEDTFLCGEDQNSSD
jgi:hypothetical protein